MATVPDTIVKITLRNAEEGLGLFGPQDRHLRWFDQQTEAVIQSRGAEIIVSGQGREVEMLRELFETLIKLIRKGYVLTARDMAYALLLAKDGRINDLLTLYEGEIIRTHRGKPVRPKTIGQSHYVQHIRKYDIVFGIGPAGTGKTYLAVVMAVAALKKDQVKRILLTRPAVEAGESLGFLPGDLQEKVDPYLRPLYDALHDVMGLEQVAKAMERGIIEVAPLAYMRGRTLDDSFVILDEAQNTTPEQMKMFLTRLGFNSKMVITGDVTQIDLPRGKQSGLKDAVSVVQHLEDIGFMQMDDSDVVRHALVQKIILAYEAREQQ